VCAWTWPPTEASPWNWRQANDYDLILMDVQMPEMNGYDATRAIRALGGARSRVPVIAMTANVMKAELDQCAEAAWTAMSRSPSSGRN